MKKVIGLIFVLILLTSSWCSDVNDCDQTSAPEINFQFLVGGTLLVEDYFTHNNRIRDFSGSDFYVRIYKIYCDGTKRGPFLETYSISDDGKLNRRGIGTWGFHMDNSEDRMTLEFFLDLFPAGKYTIHYNMLQKYNNATAYFEFKVECEYSDSQLELYPISITLTN